MRKKRINCLSCETKTDIIIWEANIDEEDIEINYCPICSTLIEDFDMGYDEDE